MYLRNVELSKWHAHMQLSLPGNLNPNLEFISRTDGDFKLRAAFYLSAVHNHVFHVSPLPPFIVNRNFIGITARNVDLSRLHFQFQPFARGKYRFEVILSLLDDRATIFRQGDRTSQQQENRDRPRNVNEHRHTSTQE